MSAPRVFDLTHYEKLNTTRAAVVGDLLTHLKGQLTLKTAIDVGCGMGYFSAYLDSLGLEVTAVDGRGENVEEAGRRVPHVRFHTQNAEDRALPDLGRFDLVLCFGLLYHLENPFAAIRNLHALTSHLLLVESVIFPGSEPMMALVDEVPNADQGLNNIAFYPTEACLVKMMYQAGFPNVFRLSRMPEHPDFHTARNVRRVRTMLAGSYHSLAGLSFDVIAEPRIPIRPWDATSGAREDDFLDRLRRFLDKPLPGKVEAVKRRLTSDKTASS